MTPIRKHGTNSGTVGHRLRGSAASCPCEDFLDITIPPVISYNSPTYAKKRSPEVCPRVPLPWFCRASVARGEPFREYLFVRLFPELFADCSRGYRDLGQSG